MTPHHPSGPMVYLVPVLAVVLIVLRNARARRLRVERLWIGPLAVLILIGLALAQEAPPGPGMLAVDLAALALGAVAGWWRGRLTHITIDPATHALTSRTSPIGMLLILALFVLRSGLRAMGAQTAGALHIPARGLADALLLVTVGVVCAQRLEIALRATRMLREARGKS